MVHTSCLELQITQQVLQFQSAELLQDHHAKFTLKSQQLCSSQQSILWNIDINAEVFSFKCISQQIKDEAHPKWSSNKL